MTGTCWHGCNYYELFFALICRCLKRQKSLVCNYELQKLELWWVLPLTQRLGFHHIFWDVDMFQFGVPYLSSWSDWFREDNLAAYANRDKFMLCLFWERIQLIGLKSFHQYDDGRKIFQRQFTAHFSIYKVRNSQRGKIVGKSSWIFPRWSFCSSSFIALVGPARHLNRAPENILELARIF